MTEQCICEICVCGRHRCAHDRGTLGQEPIQGHCKVTEYQQKYANPGNQPKRKSIHPPLHNQDLKVPLDCQTTYNGTFITHKTCPKQPTGPKRNGPEVSMDCMELNTTYTKDFTWMDGKRQKTYKPNLKYNMSETKFTGQSVYGRDFKEHSADQCKWSRRSRIIPQDNSKINPEDPQYHQTTMKESFIPHKDVDRALMIRPKCETTLANGDMDCISTYKTCYRPKELIQHAEKKQRNVYKAPSTAFVGITTARQDYHDHPGFKRTADFKPRNKYQPCKVKFDGNTITSLSFKEWEVQKPELPAWGRPKPTEPMGSEPFFKTSKYQEDYVCPPHDMEMVHPIIQVSGGIPLGSQGESFDGVTEYRMEYVPVGDAKAAKSLKVNRTYKEPLIKFQGKSMYTDNYRGVKSNRAESFAPDRRYKNDQSEKMSSKTIYRDTYIGEGPKSCPAKDIVGKSSSTVIFTTDGREFTKTATKSGHRYFVQKAANMASSPLVQLEKKRVRLAKSASSTKHISL